MRLTRGQDAFSKAVRDVAVRDAVDTSRVLRDSRLPSAGGGTDDVMLPVLAELDGFQP